MRHGECVRLSSRPAGEGHEPPRPLAGLGLRLRRGSAKDSAVSGRTPGNQGETQGVCNYRKISRSIGLKAWFLDFSAEQAVTPPTRPISACRSTKSPGFE